MSACKLKKDDWFALVEGRCRKDRRGGCRPRGRVAVHLEARRIGKFKLTLAARMNGGSNRADIVVREIEVVPNGREQSVVFNGRLETAVEHT
jgi:hypothetical protein